MIIREGRPRAIFITVVGGLAVAAMMYTSRWWGVDPTGPGGGGIFPAPGGAASSAAGAARAASAV
jgi:hypothetical protein